MAATPFRNVSPADRSLEVVGGVLEIPFLLFPNPSVASNWRAFGASSLMCLEVPPVDQLSIRIPFPRIARGRIAMISVWIRATVMETHVALPPTMPSLGLHAYAPSGGSAFTASATDESASVAAYHAEHELVLMPPAAARLSDHYFDVGIGTEYGDNALGDVTFSRLFATIVPE
jgi:hypothetical protein